MTAGAAPEEAPLTADALRALLDREGPHLKPAEVEQVAATARYLQGAVRRVREALR